MLNDLLAIYFHSCFEFAMKEVLKYFIENARKFGTRWIWHAGIKWDQGD